MRAFLFVALCKRRCIEFFIELDAGEGMTARKGVVLGFCSLIDSFEEMMVKTVSDSLIDC
jgi:hypothetical protein